MNEYEHLTRRLNAASYAVSCAAQALASAQALLAYLRKERDTWYARQIVDGILALWGAVTRSRAT